MAQLQQITVDSNSGPERVQLVPKFRGLSAVEGRVRTQESRKRVQAAAQCRTDDTVLNNVALEVDSRFAEALDARKVVQVLKQDPETAGITVGCVELAPRHKAVFHIEVDVRGGMVSLEGRVPSPEMRSYLEARVWLIDGVSRVVNGMLPMLSRRRVDVQTVAAKVLANAPGVDDAAASAVSVEDTGVARVWEPELKSTQQRAVAESLWAIPEVTQVHCVAPSN